MEAAIAAVVLPQPLVEPGPGELRGVKGEAFAIQLLRQRGATIEAEASTFGSDDRFKVALTCAEANPVHWDLVVLQAGHATFPLQPRGSVRCGNRVPMPGAFSIDGVEPAKVCVVIGADPWNRRLPGRDGRAVEPAGARCRVLWPATP